MSFVKQFEILLKFHISTQLCFINLDEIRIDEAELLFLTE